MPRRPKPENEISEFTKWRRKQKKENPVAYEKYRTWQRERYQRDKAKRQIQKKIKEKQRRIEAVALLGEKCASCNEIYNPHARMPNLQFDHKFYIKTGNMPKAPVYAVLYLHEKGIDPNTQFMLLCKTCHMAITFLRRSREKAKNIIKLASQQGII